MVRRAYSETPKLLMAKIFIGQSAAWGHLISWRAGPEVPERLEIFTPISSLTWHETAGTLRALDILHIDCNHRATLRRYKSLQQYDCVRTGNPVTAPVSKLVDPGRENLDIR